MISNDLVLQTYLGSLSAHESAAVKRRLDQLRHDCGCRIGAIVMIGVTTVWIFYMYLFPAEGRSWQRTVVTGLLVLSASALIGKIAGLILARVRFHLTVRSMRRRVLQPSRKRQVQHR